MIRFRLFGRLAFVLTILSGLVIAQVAAQDVSYEIPEVRQEKLGLNLAQLGEEYALFEQAETEGAFTTDLPNVQLAAGNMVVVDAIATDGDAAALLTNLQALGLTNGATAANLVSGTLPIRAIGSLERLPELRFAYVPLFIADVGATTSQADVAMNVATARSFYGVDGTGVTIGILSDSYNCLGGAAADIATGDLPAAGVTVLQEGTCNGNIDEGRAMAQLIHDLAPGATLLFHTAFGGEANFAQGITDLRNAGADIIVDDIRYFTESFFQDDVIAQSVDQAVINGVPYFASAGNYADRSYEGNFVNSTFGISTATFHDFDPGPERDLGLTFSVPSTRNVIFVLNWDDPSASISGVGADSDYDMQVYDVSDNVVAFSATNNIGGDPQEILSFTAIANATYDLAILHFSGPQNNFLKVVTLTSTISFSDSYFVGSSTGFGHSNAGGAAGVGAVGFFDSPAFGQSPPLAESFSSLGGVPIYYDTLGNRFGTPQVRDQPRFSATDGVNNTFFGSDTFRDADDFPNFFGTSAAAPNAAAVAGLLLACDPTLTVGDVYNILGSTAVDATRSGQSLPGYDRFTGAGLIDANAALGIACGFTLNDVDVNNDGSITPVDAIRVANSLGQSGGAEDVDNSGTVNQRDFELVVSNLGQPLTP